MKAQEIFNRVVNHLRRQGRRARRPDGTCMYRTKDGLKCAAGCLIKNSEYVAEMEGKTIGTLISEHGAHRGITPEDMYKRLHPYTEMIADLQFAHDNSIPSRWEPAFKRIAKDYNLKYVAPPKNDKR